MKAEPNHNNEIVLIAENDNEDSMLSTWRTMHLGDANVVVVSAPRLTEQGRQRLVLGLYPRVTWRAKAQEVAQDTPKSAAELDLDHSWEKVVDAEKWEEYHYQRIHNHDGTLSTFAIMVGNRRAAQHEVERATSVFVEAYRRWRKEQDERG